MVRRSVRLFASAQRMVASAVMGETPSHAALTASQRCSKAERTVSAGTCTRASSVGAASASEGPVGAVQAPVASARAHDSSKARRRREVPEMSVFIG